MERIRCATRTTIGTPAMSASGLLGNRVDARRAGISTVNGMMVLFSKTQFFVGERAGFALQQDRDAVAHRIRQPRTA
jgi:hypothetical protein